MRVSRARNDQPPLFDTIKKVVDLSVEKFFQTLLSIYDFFVLLIASSKEHDKEAEHQIINEEINLNERI